MLERRFKLRQNNSSVFKETVGGCTTFLTMSYIIFVQPAVLFTTGMDFGAVMTATCLPAGGAGGLWKETGSKKSVSAKAVLGKRQSSRSDFPSV